MKQTKPTNTETFYTVLNTKNNTFVIAKLKLRAIALIIDLFIIATLSITNIIISNWKNSIQILVYFPSKEIFIIHVIYASLMESLIGQTLGKIIVRIKAVTITGEKISLKQAFIRNFLRIVDGFIFYLVAVIAIYYSPFKQRIGDKIAKTIVIEN